MDALIRELTTKYGPPTSFTSARLGDAVGDVKRYKIDDENGHDYYAGFCRIHVTVPAGHNQILLELQNSPHNREVTKLVEDAGGEIRRDPDGTAAISITLETSDGDFIQQLARAIRGVTRRGQRYEDRNWKWISRRTADALERFASCLRKNGPAQARGREKRTGPVLTKTRLQR